MQAMMKEWKEGREPAKGPQNGRINSCGIQGRTSLTEPPRGPVSRDFEKEKA